MEKAFGIKRTDSQDGLTLIYQKKGKLIKDVINTKHILFIVSGAFDGMDKIISKRLNKRNIGFGSQPFNKDNEKTKLYGGMAEKAGKSFAEVFWNGEKKYLNDCVGPDGVVDSSLRPE